MLRASRDELDPLLARRRQPPLRVEVRDVSDAAVVKFATERKHLSNAIKMLAYQAESDLLAFASPHYSRSDDEGRTLLHELFGRAADVEVTETELRITIYPLSSPHRTVETLCKTLNESETIFPGTRLTMRFQIDQRPQVSMAFPGPRPSSDYAAATQLSP